MRRSQAAYENERNKGFAVEDENERLTDDLKDKIGVLRTLAIDMGTEVRYQHRFLDDMDHDMEHSRGFLGNTMQRVIRLSKGKHNHHILYLILFCFVVFIILWLYLKFR